MPYKLISLVFLLIFLIINKVYSENEFILPVKKPSIFKNFNKEISKNVDNNLPQKKPIILSNQPSKITQKKEPLKKKEPKKEIEVEETKKLTNIFIFPKKKPVTYKVTKKEIEKSTILNDKDFSKAKETMKFIKAKKWNSALKTADKIKDREFRTLINWMYLKHNKKEKPIRLIGSRNQLIKDKSYLTLFKEKNKCKDFIETFKQQIIHDILILLYLHNPPNF